MWAGDRGRPAAPAIPAEEVSYARHRTRLGRQGISVTIDGQAVKVLKLNKVRGAAGPDQGMIGYVIRTVLPESKAAAHYSLITITQTDAETGEGSVF
jgi:hypothetical protein